MAWGLAVLFRRSPESGDAARCEAAAARTPSATSPKCGRFRFASGLRDRWRHFWYAGENTRRRHQPPERASPSPRRPVEPAHRATDRLLTPGPSAGDADRPRPIRLARANGSAGGARGDGGGMGGTGGSGPVCPASTSSSRRRRRGKGMSNTVRRAIPARERVANGCTFGTVIGCSTAGYLAQ